MALFVLAVPAACQKALTSFVLSDNLPHIISVDGHQHVTELFYQNQKWVANDLTVSGHAPAAGPGSALTSFVLADKMPHIVFLDGHQHVDQLFYQDHKWVFNDLTASGRAPVAGSGSELNSFVLSDGMPRIVFSDGHQHVDQLFYQDNKWVFNDLTASAHAPTAESNSALTSFVLSDGLPHIIAIDNHQHLNELFYQNQKWVANDLTAISRAPLARQGSSLTSFVLADRMPHIVFLDEHQHVDQLFYQDHKWVLNDLTSSCRAPAAAAKSRLTSFVLPDGMPRIPFIDGHQHVDQLLYQDHKWVFNDLTAGGHAPMAESESGLTSFVLSDGLPHIISIDAHQHVIELFYQTQKWMTTDLTQVRNAGTK